jgi:tetratricopeptide (TPR) repeat protein
MIVNRTSSISARGTARRAAVPDCGPRVGLRLGATLMALLLVAGCAGRPGHSGSGDETTQIVSYTLATGETLQSVADDFYGDPGASGYLADSNRLSDGAVVRPGEAIDVPVGDRDIEHFTRRTEAKILYNRGTLMADRGEYDKAIEEFRAALLADPEFFDAGYNLGVVLLFQGEPARAASVLEKVISLRPNDNAALYALGKAYFDEGKPKAALLSFERVLRVDPSHEDAHFSRSLALLSLGRRNEAIVSLDVYIRTFPGGVWSDRATEKLEELAREAAEQEWQEHGN